MKNFFKRVAVVTCVGLALPAFADDATKVYWTTDKPKAIYRANTDGSGVEKLSLNGCGTPKAVAVDRRAGSVYVAWKDDQQTTRGEKSLLDYGKIIRTSPDGGAPFVVYASGHTQIGMDTDGRIVSGAEAPSSIALDVKKKRVYWCEFTGARIRRCDMGGENVTTLVANSGQPRDLALDLRGRRMYWVTCQGELRRAGLDGSNQETLLTGIGPGGIAFDRDEEVLYWTDAGGIQQADPDVKSIKTIWIAKGVGECGRAKECAAIVKFNRDDNKIYWTDPIRNKVLRTSRSGITEEVIADTRGYPLSLAIVQKAE